MRRDSKGSWIQSCRRQEGITYFISVVEKVNGVKSQLLTAVGSSRVFFVYVFWGHQETYLLRLTLHKC